MRRTLTPLAPLLVSCFIMMLGNGLINILLPVRMELEAMDTDAIGLILSLYFVGMLLGSLYARQLIRRAGHIRMFGGCLAIASVSILICSLYTDGTLWGAMRIVIGFCNACAYCAMESWLSESATEHNRGKVLAFYQVVMLVGLFLGQFAIGLYSPASNLLFIVAGILLTSSIIPVVLSRNSGPLVEEVEPMSLATLGRRSPLGLLTCFLAGMCHAAMFNMLPVYANSYDITGLDLSLYMGSAIMGGLLLQLPIGFLADRFDRRSVLLVILVTSVSLALSVNLFAQSALFWPAAIATGISAGIISCLYPIGVAEVFDKLRTSEMVSAMSCLILAFSAGGMIGPYSASLAMSLLDASALFRFLVAIQVLLCLFVIYRMLVSQALPVEDQEQMVMLSNTGALPTDLDPRTEYSEPELPPSDEAMLASEIADADPGAGVKMALAAAQTGVESSSEITEAVASADGIDALRFYRILLDEVPDQALDVTLSVVKAKPERAHKLVSQLAKHMPDQVVEIARQIGSSMPELRLKMARIAVEAAPESAVEVAEYYAQVMAEEYDAVRPADRGEDQTQEEAEQLISQISSVAPEYSDEVAEVVMDTMPDASPLDKDP
ncbi:MFS transporter [Aestuariirhabdus sp. Z084]|uniref:MFS transporter n=1 Tax=Aestuariirhabdus haliotis TaxID=2918751 RepID=UPI00201B3F5F|nr:MFS transporter [Aestuariirhabdus haliotis]MCL6417203.1 MFS transporter [Aestuariirhabdus haliotis]MCL6421175.1 MFS transporter [Aestuariirhabdus haliotis]